MASSSSEAATTVDLKKYDVFISFRGDDTRVGFTSHLHAALNRRYFETYIDYRIQKGDEVWTELEKAILDSTLFLVVFSENYANSTWCLNELVEIMKCHKNGLVVVPVFYQVDPSHVRKQTGSYGTAFANHKKQGGKNNDKMMQNWKNALFQAANLSGFHSTKYRTESDLIEDIIRDVLEKLNHNYTNDLTCSFIIDENYWSIRDLIKAIDSTKVQIIGLWGMGGIGKTTLAAAIFHKVSFHYEGSCFLENVTEVSKMHGINYTCNKLLSKLLREDFDIDTSKAIPSMIIRRLKRMKSLIVLDDVRTLELLQNLIGVGHSWLGADSMVIVTTRDKHVLISGGIEKIHQVKKMNSQNSLQLFSLNAFNKVLPNEGYVKLSERAIDYAKGNPLGLKVLGSFLRGKSEIEWNSALVKLKEIPNAEIDRILRWSYNELDDKEKNIFLDIACGCKGYKQDMLTKILNQCGFFADIGIRHLLDMALISVDFENHIQMHDLIQEMGKQIVREESPNPGKRSRLYDPKEVFDVMKNNRGTETVEAIFFYATEYTDINLSSKVFEKMVNIRLLVFQDHKEIKSISLPHGLDFLPENLRYFLWNGYPLKSLPPTFCSEMLVELSLQESNLETLWNGEMHLSNLERFDLTGSKKLIECPNMSGSPNLKCVILSNCESLLEVDSSIFCLQKLERLNIAGCTSVKSLSSNTCSPALLELNAMYCINLQEFSVTFASADQYFVLGLSNWGGNELPSSILHIKNLKTFLFPLIECLVDLPENFADRIWLENPPNCEHDPSIILHKVFPSPAFISLRHLILCNIPMLSEIPDNISLLTSLESLTLTDMAIITSLPKTIKYLPRLIELIVYDCEMLQSIPAVSLLLFHFTVSNCQSIETVLSSMGEPYYKPNPTVTLLDKPNPSTVTLINCKKLDSRSYQTVLKNWIELGARRNSSNEEDDTIQCLFPAMQSIEYWSHYSSTQVSFTLELPPNLFGFAYYLVLSQGHVGKCVSFGCECYLDNILGERICITSFQRDDIFKFRWYENIIHMMSDHLILWYDRVSCKKIMEEINDVNNTGHSPKLTFRFFFDETFHDEVKIQECGFHWIYQEEVASSTVFESHDDEDKETIPPTMKLKQRVFGNPMTKELDQTKGLRYLLE